MPAAVPLGALGQGPRTKLPKTVHTAQAKQADRRENKLEAEERKEDGKGGEEG